MATCSELSTSSQTFLSYKYLFSVDIKLNDSTLLNLEEEGEEEEEEEEEEVTYWLSGCSMKWEHYSFMVLGYLSQPLFKNSGRTCH
jgi:hypothetical protein